MRVLMLGWEFPPHISGGLGTACRGLTDAMGRMQTRILFILPKAIEAAPDEDDEVEVLQRSKARERSELVLAPAPSEVINPYQSFEDIQKKPQPAEESRSGEGELVWTPGKGAFRRGGRSSVRVLGAGTGDGYEGDLSRKIYDYACRCADLSRRELFDVIHAHDWMTFPAALAIAQFSGRPLIVHVHATEFDRAGNNVNSAIYDFERAGMFAATRVIAVSERTKRTIVERYGVPSHKVGVVHNGIEYDPRQNNQDHWNGPLRNILFLGRITMQKGPEYFVRAAARVAERKKDVRFIMAGAGDQLPYIRRLVCEFGLEDLFEFTGFLSGADVDWAYRRADVYVMPSVSEPFGLTALEAARHGVPVIISKSSGAAEVLRRGSLKVDFWDSDKMAMMIMAVLENPKLADMLRRASSEELLALSWDVAARKCISFYYDSISGGSGREQEKRPSRSETEGVYCGVR